MGVQFSGGPIVNGTINIGAAPMASFALGVAVNCASAGWTVTTLGAFTRVFGSSNATNGQTVTINGRIYTFNTVLGGADSVLIGGAALETLQNFQAAINGSAGEGTIYGTGTTPSTSVVAPAACNVDGEFGSTGPSLVLYTQGGAVTVTESSNFFVLVSPLSSVLYKLVSQETPAHQRVTAYIGASPDTPLQQLSVFIMNRNETDSIGTTTAWASLVNGQTYYFRGCRYGFRTQVNGVYNQRGQALYLEVPYLPSSLGPFQVTSVSITGGGEAVLTILEDISAAGWQTGDSVATAYNDNANGEGVDGIFTITVSGNTVTLNGSAASGTFTTGLGLIANQTPPRRQCYEQVIAGYANESGDSWPVTSTCYFGANLAGASAGSFHGVLDGVPFSNNAVMIASFPVAAMRNSVDGVVRWSWGSGDDPSLEPAMCFFLQYGGNVAGSGLGTVGARMGQLYNAYLIQDPSIPAGNTSTVDGHNFVGIYSNDQFLQVMFAID